MSYGLLRGAFRPGDEVCPLRSYARQMRRLTGDRSRCVLHMQKALTEMNVKLDSVIANITGLTGQRILRAIIDGERDPERLATLRHRGIKADADTIAASLQGTWREEHLFALEQAMQRYDFLTQQIDDCEARVMAEIERLTPPDDLPDGGAPDHAPGTTSETASSRSANAASNYTGKEGIQALALRGMMGVDLTAIPTIGPGTALVIASEIGPDFSAFPSAQHFCSWLALAPGTRISGGKNLPGKSPKAVNPVGQALRMAAMAARRSETFIGAKHRARLARMDTPVAIKATARELACLIYLMVTEGQKYVEQGIDAYEKRRLNRKFAHLDRQARKLGLQLVPAPAKRRNAKLNAVNCLGNCYSRARRLDADRRGNTLILCDSGGSNGDADQHRSMITLGPGHTCGLVWRRGFLKIHGETHGGPVSAVVRWTALMTPNTGSTVCWRSLYSSRPSSLSSLVAISRSQSALASFTAAPAPAGRKSWRRRRPSAAVATRASMPLASSAATSAPLA